MSREMLLFIGGVFDGERRSVLYGDSVIAECPNSGRREVYAIIRLSGRSALLEVAVPMDKALDGDWVMDRLIKGYRP